MCQRVVLMKDETIFPQLWPLSPLVHCCSICTPILHNDALEVKDNNQHGNEGVLQCIDCRFISGSYWNIQVLSHVTHFPKNVGSVQLLPKYPHKFVCGFLFDQWSELEHPQTFVMFRVSCKICLTSLFIDGDEKSDVTPYMTAMIKLLYVPLTLTN